MKKHYLYVNIKYVVHKMLLDFRALGLGQRRATRQTAGCPRQLTDAFPTWVC